MRYRRGGQPACAHRHRLGRKVWHRHKDFVRAPRRLGNPLVQLQHRKHLRPAQLQRLAAMCALQSGHHRLGHIADKHRLEFGIAANHRHDGQGADQRGKAVDKGILTAKDDGGAQDRGRRKSRTHRRLARAFAAAIMRVAGLIRANGGDMHQPRHARFRRRQRHIGRTNMLDGVHLVERPDKVHRHIRPGQRIGDRARLCNVTSGQRHLTQIAQRLYQPRRPRVAHRHPNPSPRRAQCLHNIAPNKAAAAKNRDHFAVQIVHNWGLYCGLDNGFDNAGRFAPASGGFQGGRGAVVR